MLLVFVGMTTAAYAQLYDYSVIGQVTNDFWEGEGGSEFEIGPPATGVQAGQMADDGFDVDGAGTLLLPLSLTLSDQDGDDTATFSGANFGGGLAGRIGIGYGLSPFRGLVITPGAAWYANFSSYSFDFPGGATTYREITHGPAAVGQVAFMLNENFWFQSWAMYGYYENRRTRLFL
ncbi:MAG: hypothetical protein ACOCZ9_02835 [Spirochaetota bacterium]